jgi:hypothetical protein
LAPCGSSGRGAEGKGPGGAREAEGEAREGLGGFLLKVEGFPQFAVHQAERSQRNRLCFRTAGQRSRCNPKRPQSGSVGRWQSRTDRRTEHRPISVVRSRQIRSDAPRRPCLASLRQSGQREPLMHDFTERNRSIAQSTLSSDNGPLEHRDDLTLPSSLGSDADLIEAIDGPSQNERCRLNAPSNPPETTSKSIVLCAPVPGDMGPVGSNASVSLRFASLDDREPGPRCRSVRQVAKLSIHAVVSPPGASWLAGHCVSARRVVTTTASSHRGGAAAAQRSASPTRAPWLSSAYQVASPSETPPAAKLGVRVNSSEGCSRCEASTGHAQQVSVAAMTASSCANE